MKLVLALQSFLTDRSFVDLFYFLFVFAVLSCLCHGSLMVTCWERADFLALLYVMFACVFVTFPYGILGQVRYLIVSIPILCFLHYIINFNSK